MLELSASAPLTPSAQARILDAWLRNGHETPPIPDPSVPSPNDIQIEVAPQSSTLPLRLVNPAFHRSKVFYLPLQKGGNLNRDRNFLLYLSGGAVGSTSPFIPGSLRASVFSCSDPKEFSAKHCEPIQPEASNLLPVTHPHQEFPVSGAGSDETEGVVFFEGRIPSDSTNSWVAVKVDGANGGGWVVAGFANESFRVRSDASSASS